MGTWGTGISSNDTFADVYAEFFDLYNQGKEIPEITKTVISKNDEILEIPDDVNNLWFTIAKPQWECKYLQPEIYQRVKEIIESDVDLAVWEDLGATKSDITQRKRVLAKFLSQLQSERAKPKARKTFKPKKIVQAFFGKGTCLAFKLTDDRYGGAVVLESAAKPGFGLNLLALTKINQDTLPTIQDFVKAKIIVEHLDDLGDKPAITWMFNFDSEFESEKEKSLFQVIGNIEIDQLFDPDRYDEGYSYCGGWEHNIILRASLQFQHEGNQKWPKLRVKVKQFQKRRWCWF